jgi:hypothetical protein
MDRYNRGAGSASAPSAPAGPANPYFTEGNPTLGVPATQPGPWWFHMITEELRAVIVAAGLTPDHTDVTQLTQAIAALISDAQRAVILDNAAFEASVADGEVVYWDSANSRFDEALADGTAKQNAVGIADVTNSKVYAFGSCPILSGLTPGAYYLDATTPGAITTVAPATNIVKLGIAKTATEMFVDIDESLTSNQASIQGAFSNLKGSATGTSPIVTYTADEIVTGDNAGNFQSLRTWSGTITMTTAGAGGLDTGTVAPSSWYYAFAISKADGTKAFMASLSATAPNMPSGYTKLARIGSFRTDATANKYPLGFQQYGKTTQYKIVAGSNLISLPQMSSGVQGTVGTTLVATGVANFVPPTAARIMGRVGAAGTVSVQVSPNSIAAMPGFAGVTLGNASASYSSNAFDFALESTNIYYAGSSAAADMRCVGYEDNF